MVVMNADAPEGTLPQRIDSVQFFYLRGFSSRSDW
jgi:hypothetical protein